MPSVSATAMRAEFPSACFRRSTPMVLALAILLAGCSKKPGPDMSPPEAGFVVMKAESVPLVIELAGRTSAYESSEVRPQVSGVVKQRAFTEGSLVHAGQTLYQ